MPALIFISLFFILSSCHKDAAPVQQVLSEQQKMELMAKVRADTLFKQWQANSKQVAQSLVIASKTAKIDTAYLKTSKAKTEEEFISNLKNAGVPNAEEILFRYNEGMRLLKELWNKYPDVYKLSHEELLQLTKRNLRL